MPITRRAVTAAALSMLAAPALAKSPRGTLVYVGTQGAEPARASSPHGWTRAPDG